MHDQDFELLSEEPRPDGKIELRVHIKAMNLSRRYVYDPSNNSLSLEDEPILVSDHDMTSITGKRVREWLRSIREGR
jgi:hypothetical protein